LKVKVEMCWVETSIVFVLLFALMKHRNEYLSCTDDPLCEAVKFLMMEPLCFRFRRSSCTLHSISSDPSSIFKLLHYQVKISQCHAQTRMLTFLSNVHLLLSCWKFFIDKK